MSVYDKVLDASKGKDGTRKTISDFLLDTGKDVRYYSLSQISDVTFTSKSTLVRYAQKFGYPGWNEFMDEFVESLRFEASHANAINANLPIREGDKPDTIIKNLAQLKIETLTQCANSIDPMKLKQASDMILSARNTYVFGGSPNSIYANLFRRRMQNIGHTVTVVSTDEAGTVARYIHPDDCVILISYSGNNPERRPLSLVPILAQRTKHMIGITGDSDNQLYESIPCTITIPVTEKLYTKLATFSTGESIQLVLDSIYGCCFAANYTTNLNKKIDIAKDTESARQASSRKMKED